MATMKICLLLAEHCAAANATLTLEVLGAANRFSAAAEPPFACTTASLDGRSVATFSGQRLAVDAALDDVGPVDLVIIPGFLFTLREALPSFVRYGDWLRRQHAQGAVLASMCTASFLLAESGLLDGRTATTHWAFASLFRRRYPAVRLDERLLLCDDGQVVTSGGATAAMDLLQHLLQRLGPPEVAEQCAHHLLVDRVREFQAPYALWKPSRGHGDEGVLRVQDWLETHHALPVSIDALASRFGFGERQFKRRFKEATGLAPLAYLQALRLEAAKRLLQGSRQSLESITAAVGYEDVSSFRRLFQREVGLSPSAFREKFRPAATMRP